MQGGKIVDIWTTLLAISTLVAVGYIFYQYRNLQTLQQEKEKLEKKIQEIEDGLNSEIEEKRERISQLNRQIEELHQRAEFIKLDQIELNREYEYLQERNRKLEETINSLEDRIRHLDKE